MAEIAFPAMGTTAHVVVVDGHPAAPAVARRRIEELERRWSRFLPDSEVSRLNAGDLLHDELHPHTRRLLHVAAEAHRVTGGRFDPYRLADLAAAGYVGSIDGSPPTGAPLAGFDPGGIGKGLAADIVTAEVLAGGAAGVMVNLGGDLRVRGAAPDGGDWRIDIDDPDDPTGVPVARIRLRDGGVATSTPLKRRWVRADGSVAHHLIDPRTAAPSTSTVRSTTVVTREAWQAEALCKLAFLDGDGAGLGTVEALGAAALVITPSLHLTTSRWAGFAVEAEVAR